MLVVILNESIAVTFTENTCNLTIIWTKNFNGQDPAETPHETDLIKPEYTIFIMILR
jgi:hypothetical protein